MATRDYARYLPASLASLRAQTYRQWECIIVDDGSTDDTPAVIGQLIEQDTRIRYLRQDQRGPAIARNRGIEAARGAYVQFLDADDLMPIWKLAGHVDYLQANPEVDIVYGPSMYFDDGTPGTRRTAIRDLAATEPAKVDGVGRPIVDVLIRQNVLTIEAPLTRRAVFEQLGAFDEELRRITDWQFWLRCAIAGKRFSYLPSPEPVVLIRVHGASLSHDETVMRLVEIEMRRKLGQLLPEGPARDTNAFLLAEVSASMGITLGLRGNLAGGLRLLVPAAIAQRRRSWLMWSLALLASPIPFVRARLADRRFGAGPTPGANSGA